MKPTYDQSKNSPSVHALTFWICHCLLLFPSNSSSLKWDLQPRGFLTMYQTLQSKTSSGDNFSDTANEKVCCSESASRERRSQFQRLSPNF